MSNQAVDVQILGRTTRVNCPAGQEASLLAAAEDLNRRLKEMTERTKVTNDLQLLTFAALNICYELNTPSQQEKSELQLMVARIEQLNASLETALHRIKQR